MVVPMRLANSTWLGLLMVWVGAGNKPLAYQAIICLTYAY
jgi:hypothetical protein